MGRLTNTPRKRTMLSIMTTDVVMKKVHATSFFVPGSVDNLKRAEEIRIQHCSEDSRLVTLPDVIDARIRSNQSSPAWKMPYITTNTVVYIGNSRNNLPLIVIAHGVGPMATFDGAYEFSRLYDDIAFERKKKFDSLVEGRYGEVSIIEFSIIRKMLHSPIGFLTLHQALEDPFLTALLGTRAEEYFTILAQTDIKRQKALADRHVVASHFGFESRDIFQEIEYGPVGYYVNADLVGGHSCETCTLMLSRFTLCSPGAPLRFAAFHGDRPVEEILYGKE